MLDDGYNITLYTDKPADGYCLATRKNQAEWLKSKVKDMKADIKEMEAEIEFLTKYKDDEEFVADKIDQLVKADTVKAKADILRLLKKSNYI